MTDPVIVREHIGVIRSERLIRDGTPVRSGRAIGREGWFKVVPPLAQGLGEVEGSL